MIKTKHKTIVLVLTGIWLIAIFSLQGCAPKVRAPESLLDTPEHHVQNGMKLLKLGKYDDAMREFELAKELDPKFSGAYVGSGLVFGYKGGFKEGIQDMDKAVGKKDGKKTVTKLKAAMKAVAEAMKQQIAKKSESPKPLVYGEEGIVKAEEEKEEKTMPGAALTSFGQAAATDAQG